MVFSSSHIWMWELDYKESWAPKNWCFWNMVLEKTPEIPLDSKEIQPVHPKGIQSWIFIGSSDAEAETEAPILWPPDAKNWLIGKDPDAVKDFKAGWKGDNKGLMALATWCTWVWASSGSWWWTGEPGVLQFMGHKESNTTELLKWTELNFNFTMNSLLEDSLTPWKVTN